MNDTISLQYAKFLMERDVYLMIPLLVGTFSSIANFDAWRAVIVSKSGEDETLDFRNNLRSADGERGIEIEDDPILEIARADVGEGFFNSLELAPRGLRRTKFAERCEENGLSLVDHAGFVAKIDEDRSLCISFSRSELFTAFSCAECNQFSNFAPFAMHGMKLIWKSRSQMPHRSVTHRIRAAKAKEDAALQSFGLTALTPRECDVVQLLVTGHSAKSIARALDMAIGTVRNHIKHIYLKLGLSSRAELYERYLKEIMLCQAA
ncbi:MAG: LuxR C-terminal-related transcriptional regulator [Pseudomonadota bacterium]